MIQDFKTIKKAHLDPSEKWRFPSVNIFARKTITCNECDTTIVEVIDKKNKIKIKNVKNYPVYAREEVYYGSNDRYYCEKCWEKNKK